ncbi:hypothetical protein, partial [Aquabacterium sp. UBA2148]|uniref:hypothetical protein n=1 Tax=Aquabacterium sp. UBA2148 TaxID=1946042 RepID=UPI0039C875C4
MRPIFTLLAPCLALLACLSWAGPSAVAPQRKPAASVAEPAGGVRTATELCAQMVRRLPNVSRPLCTRAELQAGPGASVRGTP